MSTPDVDTAARQQLVTVLTTEQYVMQMARSATVQEAMGRITTFLTAVSGGLVALGFVAQSTNMEGNFYVFAEFVLATLVFIGVATFWRVQQTGLDDLVLARGMGRVRAALLEMVPEARPGITQPVSDDPQIALAQYGFGWFQLFASGSGMVGVVTGAVAAALAAVVALQFGLGGIVALGAGAVVLGTAGFVQVQVQARGYEASLRAYDRSLVRKAP